MTTTNLARKLISNAVREAAKDWLGEHRATSDVIARIVWSKIAEPGNPGVGALISQHGPYRALTLAADTDTVQVFPTTAGAIAAAIVTAHHAQLSLLTPDDEDWPTQLNDLEGHTPVVLYARGSAVLAGGTHGMTAILGDDHPTPDERDDIAFLARQATERTLVLTGDDETSRTAFTAATGPVIAYSSGGADRSHPYFDDIVRAGGAIISPSAPSTDTTPWRELDRERLIIAHSGETVVLERRTAGRVISLAHQLSRPAGHLSQVARDLGARG